MKNKFYFKIKIFEQQITYAKKLVDFSLKNHPIPNIWDNYKKGKTFDLRYTGTLGEVVFADLYKLNRPTRSFGAIDGQDFGKDFEINIRGKKMNFDVKTMHRKSSIFYKNYVLNIPARNVNRADSITDYYYCISLHEEKNISYASVLGYIPKVEIVENKVGNLYKKGVERIRGDNTSFLFQNDTYEIEFQNITTPFVSNRIKAFEGIKFYQLK